MVDSILSVRDPVCGMTYASESVAVNAFNSLRCFVTRRGLLRYMFIIGSVSKSFWLTLHSIPFGVLSLCHCWLGGRKGI